MLIPITQDIAINPEEISSMTIEQYPTDPFKYFILFTMKNNKQYKLGHQIGAAMTSFYGEDLRTLERAQEVFDLLQDEINKAKPQDA